MLETAWFYHFSPLFGEKWEPCYRLSADVAKLLIIVKQHHVAQSMELLLSSGATDEAAAVVTWMGKGISLRSSLSNSLAKFLSDSLQARDWAFISLKDL